MELLESPWFFRMVEQQEKTPEKRLLAVFSITETWMSAPGIRDRLQASRPPGCVLYHCDNLKAFLTSTATAARARNPVSLANQLVILLQGAIAEELRNPDARAIGEAGKAARAIIGESCSRRQVRPRHALGGIAAAALVAVLGFYTGAHAPWSPVASQTIAQLTPESRQARPGIAFNPDSVEAVLALQEQINKGVCPAPQLLALPQGQVTAYMNVIQFRTPDDPVADREHLRAFLAWFERTRASECYQPPSNGHTTVAWVAS